MVISGNRVAIVDRCAYEPMVIWKISNATELDSNTVVALMRHYPFLMDHVVPERAGKTCRKP